MYTCEFIYKWLFANEKKRLIHLNILKEYSDDYINRKANMYAVQNTVKVWEEQYTKQYHNLYKKDK